MRLWEFDRLGVVGSTTPFDINKDARMLVSVVLGYLWMSEEDLGFDPTVVEDGRANAKRFQRRSRKERDGKPALETGSTAGTRTGPIEAEPGTATPRHWALRLAISSAW